MSNNHSDQLASLTINQSESIPIMNNTNLILNFANIYRRNFVLSTIPSVLNIFLPFPCDQTNATGFMMSTSWSMIDQTIDVSLSNCSIGLLISSNSTVNVQEVMLFNNTPSQAKSTSSSYNLALRCENYCYNCIGTNKSYCN
jgi:hypothetical protein